MPLPPIVRYATERMDKTIEHYRHVLSVPRDKITLYNAGTLYSRALSENRYDRIKLPDKVPSPVTRALVSPTINFYGWHSKPRFISVFSPLETSSPSEGGGGGGAGSIILPRGTGPRMSLRDSICVV